MFFLDNSSSKSLVLKPSTALVNVSNAFFHQNNDGLMSARY